MEPGLLTIVSHPSDADSNGDSSPTWSGAPSFTTSSTSTPGKAVIASSGVNHLSLVAR